MSWGVTAKGTADDVGRAFQDEADRAVARGSSESLLRDIDFARSVSVEIVDKVGVVEISAGGHWDTTTDGEVRTSFYVNARLQI